MRIHVFDANDLAQAGVRSQIESDIKLEGAKEVGVDGTPPDAWLLPVRLTSLRLLDLERLVDFYSVNPARLVVFDAWSSATFFVDKPDYSVLKLDRGQESDLRRRVEALREAICIRSSWPAGEWDSVAQPIAWPNAFELIENVPPQAPVHDLTLRAPVAAGLDRTIAQSILTWNRRQAASSPSGRDRAAAMVGMALSAGMGGEMSREQLLAGAQAVLEQSPTPKAAKLRADMHFDLAEPIPGRPYPSDVEEITAAIGAARLSRVVVTAALGEGYAPPALLRAAALGRPCIIFGAQRLPFDDAGVYDDWCIRYPAAEAVNAGELIDQWLRQRSDQQLVELGKRARAAWAAKFSPAAQGRLLAQTVERAING